MNHIAYCENLNNSIVILPTEEEDGNILKLKNYGYKESVTFAVYAEIECLLEPVKNPEIDKAVYQKHIPIHSAVLFISLENLNFIAKKMLLNVS